MAHIIDDESRELCRQFVPAGFTHGTSRNAPQFGLLTWLKCFCLFLFSFDRKPDRPLIFQFQPPLLMKKKKKRAKVMAISIPSFDCFLFGVGLYVYNTVLTLDIVNDGPSVKTQPYRSAPTPGKGPAAAPLRAAVSPPSFVSLYVIFVAAPYSSTLHHFAIVHFFVFHG